MSDKSQSQRNGENGGRAAEKGTSSQDQNRNDRDFRIGQQNTNRN